MKKYFTSKEFYFDFLHVYITVSIIAWCSFFSIPQRFSLFEVYLLSAILGTVAGRFIAGGWEYGIEEQIMKRPSSRKDIIVMTITGAFSGVIFCNVYLSLYILIPMALLSCGFVFFEVREWYKNRK